VTDNPFMNVNGSQPVPQNPLEHWPVPLAPMMANIGFAIVDAIAQMPDGTTRASKMIRVDLFNQGGYSCAFFDPQDMQNALQKGMHAAKAAKSGLDLPPGAQL
jgi:hypothetical protein